MKPSFKIDKNGRWIHEGREIHRQKLVKLFSTILKRDEQGRYWLQTPVEKVEVIVEDAPFIVTDLKIDGEGENRQITFITNVEEEIPLESQKQFIVRDGIPYIAMRDNLEAKLRRRLVFDLADLCVDRHEKTGFYSAGQFFEL